MVSVPEGRVCTRCGLWKTASEFHRHPKTGLHPCCKVCRSELRRGSPVEQAYRRRYQEKHAEQIKARAKERYWSDPDRFRAAARGAYYADHAENKARMLARYYANRDAYLQANREWAERHPERKRELVQRWREANHDRVIEHAQASRARKLGSPGNFTRAEFRTLCERFGNVCLACGTAAVLVADHVVPLARGGSNLIDNIQPLCRSCNAKKRLNDRDYRPEADRC